MNSEPVCAEFDEKENRHRLAQLNGRGVRVWGAGRVYVGKEVRLERICAGAELLNAWITGEGTFIGSRARIGTSGLARIHQSQIGPSARVGAGSYENCVLLAGVKTRGFAEIREGTLLEEEAEIGHNVGLKNTVLTVGTVAGSCINYCDVLISGGSSRRDHNEIGSGAVHFNFDPRGDKFGSLFGDVTGCLLRSPRIFIGGNSSVIAPVRVGFGAVIPAGTIVRKDVAANELHWEQEQRTSGHYDLDVYFDLRRKFCVTASLIGNLQALCAWYRLVRAPFAGSEEKMFYAAAEQEMSRHIEHRIQQLLVIVDKLEQSLSKVSSSAEALRFAPQHRKLQENREQIRQILTPTEHPGVPPGLISDYEAQRSSWDHPAAVRHLSEEAIELARSWLLSIAERPHRKMQAMFVERMSLG